MNRNQECFPADGREAFFISGHMNCFDEYFAAATEIPYF
jgi:hypothetical protein